MKSMWAKQGSGCFDSDSDDSNNKDSWKDGLNQAKQMHVLASAGINPNERNIDIDDDDIKRYKKQAKEEMNLQATRKCPPQTNSGANRYSQWYAISMPIQTIRRSKTLDWKCCSL